MQGNRHELGKQELELGHLQCSLTTTPISSSCGAATSVGLSCSRGHCISVGSSEGGCIHEHALVCDMTVPSIEPDLGADETIASLATFDRAAEATLELEERVIRA